MIEVRIAGQGRVRGDVVTPDPEQTAVCDLCGDATDSVASVTAALDTFACKACLRGRLEAMTLGAWLVRPGEALPWGKITS
ncbi:MAG: hypothetical protein H6737_30630 [Alphaproteobacteria bacterium]|nr:hypothetical protein [Alphaproteobacteria bacterium]